MVLPHARFVPFFSLRRVISVPVGTGLWTVRKRDCLRNGPSGTPVPTNSFEPSPKFSPIMTQNILPYRYRRAWGIPKGHGVSSGREPERCLWQRKRRCSECRGRQGASPLRRAPLTPGTTNGSSFLLRCPISSSATMRLRQLSTAATRSGRSSRPWRRSHRSPFGRFFGTFLAGTRKARPRQGPAPSMQGML